jgi:fermentation-respiration switch protein FrsA (DUF1100 family)
MQTRFAFRVDGEELIGNLYRPPAGEIAVGVVTGPLTSVKEQASGAWARALARRGIASLAFDHRYFGESGGKPRQLENPQAKIEDIRAAVGALRRDPELASKPMVAVGICAGAGYMARAVAEDPRFCAFATIAGSYTEATVPTGAADLTALKRAQAAERRWRATGVAETIPAVAPDNGDVAMPLSEAFAYYGTPRGAVPNYVNGFAVQSRVYTMSFDALGAARLIKVPTALVHSERALAPALARRFQADLDDARIVWLTSQGQVDFYDDEALIARGADAVVEFLAPRLRNASCSTSQSARPA